MVGNTHKHTVRNYLLMTAAGIAAFIFSVASFGTPAHAITISQLNVEIVAKPGETVDQMVQIYDETYTGNTVYPAVYNFTENPDREGGVRLLTDPADQNIDRSWVQWKTVDHYGVDKEIYDILEELGLDEEEEEEEEAADASGTDEEAGETADEDEWGQEEVPINLSVEAELTDFPYRIVIPKDAEPGTHLISLVYQLRPAAASGEERTAVYIGTNLVTNLFIKVLGATIDEIGVDFQSGTFGNKDSKTPAAVRKESFEPKRFFLKPPVDFLVTINNLGNTHQKPDGRILITNDLFGSSFPEQIKVNETNRIILPGTDRTFDVSSFGRGFMFGKYRAKIEILYGDPLQAIEQEIDFWIVPLVEILVALGILLVIFITIYIIRRRGKKKREKKELEREKKELEREKKLREEIMQQMKGGKAVGKKTSDQKGKKQDKPNKKKDAKGKGKK